MGSRPLMRKGPRSQLGINAQNDKVFCFQDILSGLLFKVRAGVRLWDGDGDGFCHVHSFREKE